MVTPVMIAKRDTPSKDRYTLRKSPLDTPSGDSLRRIFIDLSGDPLRTTPQERRAFGILLRRALGYLSGDPHRRTFIESFR